MSTEEEPVEEMDIHTWFGLTYAGYLVLPRTLLQSMPKEWQVEFTRMLRQLDESYSHIDHPDTYSVIARKGGKFTKDPVPHYAGGHTHVAPRLPMEEGRPGHGHSPAEISPSGGAEEGRGSSLRSAAS